MYIIHDFIHSYGKFQFPETRQFLTVIPCMSHRVKSLLCRTKACASNDEWCLVLPLLLKFIDCFNNTYYPHIHINYTVNSISKKYSNLWWSSFRKRLYQCLNSKSLQKFAKNLERTLPYLVRESAYSIYLKIFCY